MNANQQTTKEPIELPAAAWRDSVGQALQAAGQRATKPREAILDWIAATTAPFTAETLVEELATRQGLSSRPTIYRTLEWLRSANWIGRVQSDGIEHTYARLLPGHYHHAVCTACGDTLVIAGCDALQTITAALAQQGFEIQGHVLEVFGQCLDCRRRQPPT